MTLAAMCHSFPRFSVLPQSILSCRFCGARSALNLTTVLDGPLACRHLWGPTSPVRGALHTVIKQLTGRGKNQFDGLSANEYSTIEIGKLGDRRTKRGAKCRNKTRREGKTIRKVTGDRSTSSVGGNSRGTRSSIKLVLEVFSGMWGREKK